MAKMYFNSRIFVNGETNAKFDPKSLSHRNLHRSQRFVTFKILICFQATLTHDVIYQFFLFWLVFTCGTQVLKHRLKSAQVTPHPPPRISFMFILQSTFTLHLTLYTTQINTLNYIYSLYSISNQVVHFWVSNSQHTEQFYLFLQRC